MGSHVLLLFCILAALSSCSGQPTSASAATTTPGDTVVALSNAIWCIFQAKNGDHWFGSDGDGAYRYDGRTMMQFSMRDGLSGDRIRGIQEDRHGNIYFSTLEGINKFDGTTFTKLTPTPSISPNNWKLQPEDLWFSMLGRNGEKGPYRYDGRNLYQLEFPKHYLADAYFARSPNNAWSPYEVYSIYKDSNGNMWFGTGSFGVCRNDGRTISWLYEDHLTNVPGGGSFGIRSIMEDAQGKFWFGNTRYRYNISPDSTIENEKDLINYEREEGIGGLRAADGNDHIYFISVVEDDQGDLWMATYDQGVWRYDGTNVSHYPVKEGDRDVTLFSIYKDMRGTLWLGSHDAGAFRFDGQGFERFLP